MKPITEHLHDGSTDRLNRDNGTPQPIAWMGAGQPFAEHADARASLHACGDMSEPLPLVFAAAPAAAPDAHRAAGAVLSERLSRQGVYLSGTAEKEIVAAMFEATAMASTPVGPLNLYTSPIEELQPARTGTVADIPDADLLLRAMRVAIARRPASRYAWAKIQDAFVLGSTYAWQLCQRFGFDPETGRPIVGDQS